jgi:organic radical activating enzyme
MNEDDEHLDDVSSDYIQRPEDPYPILQSTRTNSNLIENDDTHHTIETNDEQDQSATDEMDVYLKSMSPYKHQAYLIDDVLQSVFNKFLVAQQQSEQRFMSFINEQKRDDQEREERIHREQRQHQLELIQLIINQGTQLSRIK